MLRGHHYGRPDASQLLAALVLVSSMAYQYCESFIFMTFNGKNDSMAEQRVVASEVASSVADSSLITGELFMNATSSSKRVTR